MTNFVLMLTENDRTVENAHAILDNVAPCQLDHIGFKDVGLPWNDLRALADRIHDLGARAYLEVVSVDPAAELRSIEAGIELGVDAILGGTHVDEALSIIADAPVEYWPFPGEIIGHPSVLAGDIASIVASAVDLSSRDGVDGLDLLAYRFSGDVPALTQAVVRAVQVPVLAAGSVDSADRIAALQWAGVWGFTVGSAVLNGSMAIHAPSSSVADLVAAVATRAGS